MTHQDLPSSPEANLEEAASQGKASGIQELNPATNAAKRWGLRIAMVLSGVMLVVGFFLPWIRLGEMAAISGLELMISDNIVVREAMGVGQRRLMGLVPVVGLLCMVFGAKGLPGMRWVAKGGGLLLVLLGLLAVVTLFVKTTSAGLWLSVGGAFVALATSLLESRKR